MLVPDGQAIRPPAGRRPFVLGLCRERPVVHPEGEPEQVLAAVIRAAGSESAKEPGPSGRLVGPATNDKSGGLVPDVVEHCFVAAKDQAPRPPPGEPDGRVAHDQSHQSSEHATYPCPPDRRPRQRRRDRRHQAQVSDGPHVKSAGELQIVAADRVPSFDGAPDGPGVEVRPGRWPEHVGQGLRKSPVAASDGGVGGGRVGLGDGGSDQSAEGGGGHGTAPRFPLVRQKSEDMTAPGKNDLYTPGILWHSPARLLASAPDVSQAAPDRGVGGGRLFPGEPFRCADSALRAYFWG